MQPVDLVQTSLAGVPSSVTQARRFTEEALEDLGLGALSWEAVLLVSELVTNAVLHARSDLTLGLEQLGPGEIRIAVSDGSPKHPSKRTFSDHATTGRGLRLLEELSTSWGVTTFADGKTVWAVVRLPQEQRDGYQDTGAATTDDVAAILAGFPDVDDLADGATLRCAA